MSLTSLFFLNYQLTLFGRVGGGGGAGGGEEGRNFSKISGS